MSPGVWRPASKLTGVGQGGGPGRPTWGEWRGLTQAVHYRDDAHAKPGLHLCLGKWPNGFHDRASVRA